MCTVEVFEEKWNCDGQTKIIFYFSFNFQMRNEISKKFKVFLKSSLLWIKLKNKVVHFHTFSTWVIYKISKWICWALDQIWVWVINWWGSAGQSAKGWVWPRIPTIGIYIVVLRAKLHFNRDVSCWNWW